MHGHSACKHLEILNKNLSTLVFSIVELNRDVLRHERMFFVCFCVIDLSSMYSVSHPTTGKHGRWPANDSAWTSKCRSVKEYEC